jgi:hypothetical protein
MLHFQKAITKSHIDNQQKDIEKYYKVFQKNFGNDEKKLHLRSVKEEQYQEGFVRELFCECLGYTIFPTPNYNIVTEYKTEVDGTKVDAVIMKNDNKNLGESNVTAVIELKDYKTPDLKSVEDQAFRYKNKIRNVPYVITSNFQKIRLYIDNYADYKEFNLFEMNQNSFAEMYLCLGYKNLLNDLPKKLKADKNKFEEDITKKFYREYSAFKKDIFENVIANNPKHDKLTLFKKSQKLLNRFLFIMFAEDTGIITANTIQEKIIGV